VALRRLSNSSIQTNGKSSKLWDQTTFQSNMFALATVSLTSTASSVTFSDIPANYTHLQIRGAFTATGADQNVVIQVGNNTIDTGNNYSNHIVLNNNGTVIASSSTSASSMNFLGLWYGASSNSTFIIDCLDYSKTNKNKTFRSLFGNENNTSGQVGIGSGLWMNQSAITTITIKASSAQSFNANSHFALYGIKVA